ncbi:MAG: hypothetical protein AB7O74_01200 [Candidatus Nanopelagicales bacterium]
MESSDDAVTHAGPHGRLSFVRVPPHVAAAYPLDDPVQRRTDNPVTLVLPVPSLAAVMRPPRRVRRSRRPGVGLGRRTARGRRRPEGDVVGPLEPAQDRS